MDIESLKLEKFTGYHHYKDRGAVRQKQPSFKQDLRVKRVDTAIMLYKCGVKKTKIAAILGYKSWRSLPPRFRNSVRA